jgi:hypothetical protein
MEPEISFVSATDLWGLDDLQKFYELVDETPYASMAEHKIVRLMNLFDFLKTREQFVTHYTAVSAYLDKQTNPSTCYLVFDV